MNSIISNLLQSSFIWKKDDAFGANRNGTICISDHKVAFEPFLSTVCSLYLISFDFLIPMIEDISGVFNPIIAKKRFHEMS